MPIDLAYPSSLTGILPDSFWAEHALAVGWLKERPLQFCSSRPGRIGISAGAHGRPSGPGMSDIGRGRGVVKPSFSIIAASP